MTRVGARGQGSFQVTLRHLPLPVAHEHERFPEFPLPVHLPTDQAVEDDHGPAGGNEDGRQDQPVHERERRVLDQVTRGALSPRHVAHPRVDLHGPVDESRRPGEQQRQPARQQHVLFRPSPRSRGLERRADEPVSIERHRRQHDPGSDAGKGRACAQDPAHDVTVVVEGEPKVHDLSRDGDQAAHEVEDSQSHDGRPGPRGLELGPVDVDGEGIAEETDDEDESEEEEDGQQLKGPLVAELLEEFLRVVGRSAVTPHDFRTPPAWCGVLRVRVPHFNVHG